MFLWEVSMRSFYISMRSFYVSMRSFYVSTSTFLWGASMFLWGASMLLCGASMRSFYVSMRSFYVLPQNWWNLDKKANISSKILKTEMKCILNIAFYTKFTMSLFFQAMQHSKCYCSCIKLSVLYRTTFTTHESGLQHHQTLHICSPPTIILTSTQHKIYLLDSGVKKKLPGLIVLISKTCIY